LPAYYQILRELGCFASGACYLARDTRSQQEVDLRIFAAAGSIPPIDLSLLQHPHICRVYETGVQDGVPFIAQEHLQGDTLADKIQSRIALGDALRYGIEIADALDHLHGRVSMVAELNPSAILLTAGGVKLTDLPFLRPAIAGAGLLRGFQAYISPEELMGATLRPAGDIFRFGIILYQMLSGNLPFPQGGYFPGVMFAEPPPLDISPELRRIVYSCLAKESAARPSASGVRADLAAFTTTLGCSASKI
jgi:serine/threonine-protein kinase